MLRWMTFGVEILILIGIGTALINFYYIGRKLRRIMANQEQLEALVATAQGSLDTITTELVSISEAITAESQQIADFIANSPDSLDTTTLEGFVSNLNAAATRIGTVKESVEGIFTPPAPATPEA